MVVNEDEWRARRGKGARDEQGFRMLDLVLCSTVYWSEQKRRTTKEE
jgi:hypothetical protein